jgi:hypothetical protein
MRDLAVDFALDAGEFLLDLDFTLRSYGIAGSLVTEGRAMALAREMGSRNWSEGQRQRRT